MSVARSVLLVAVGAALYFAPDLEIGFASLDLVGLALMVAGDAGLLLALVGHAVWTKRAERSGSKVA